MDGTKVYQSIFQTMVDPLENQKSFTEDDIQKANSRLTDLIRLRILQSPLPSNMTVISLRNGQVTLMAKNEFLATLTLGKKEVPFQFGNKYNIL